jgi:hypothetical protein
MKVGDVGGKLSEMEGYTEEEKKALLEDIEANKKLVEQTQKAQGVKTLTEKERQHEYYLKWKERQTNSRKEQQKKEHREWYLKHREERLAHQKELDAKTGRPHKATKGISVPNSDSAYSPQADGYKIVIEGTDIKLECPENPVTLQIAIELLQNLLKRMEERK